MPNGGAPSAGEQAQNEIDDVRLTTGREMTRIATRFDIMERDMDTLREKIARLSEQDTCADCHNHMPGLSRSKGAS